MLQQSALNERVVSISTHLHRLHATSWVALPDWGTRPQPGPHKDHGRHQLLRWAFEALEKRPLGHGPHVRSDVAEPGTTVCCPAVQIVCGLHARRASLPQKPTAHAQEYSSLPSLRHTALGWQPPLSMVQRSISLQTCAQRPCTASQCGVPVKFVPHLQYACVTVAARLPRIQEWSPSSARELAPPSSMAEANASPSTPAPGFRSGC